MARLIPERIIRSLGVGGAVLLLAALLLYFYDQDVSTRVFILIIAGIAGLSAWIGFAPDDVRDWISGRQAAAGTTSVILTVMFTAVVVIIYAQFDRQNATIDFTGTERYSLSPPTLAAIEELKARGQAVRIVGFFPRSLLREKEAADILLRQYDEQGGDLIDVQFIDPDENPLLANQYAYNSLTNRTQAIYMSFVNDDGSPDAASIQFIGNVDERTISTTLIDLITVRSTKFYFTIGHTELDIASQSTTGLFRAQNELARLGVAAETINLLIDPIPEDATALVIAGPSSAFDDAEVEQIAAFVEGGGRLIVMANPPYIDATFGGLSVPLLAENVFATYLWDTFGVRFRDDLVVDPVSSIDSDFNPIPVGYNTQHEILRDFSSTTSVIFSLARSIEARDDVPLEYLVEPLLWTSNEAYGESELQNFDVGNLSTFDEESDTIGPLVMAASVRAFNELDQANTPRILLIGDIDWLSNQFISAFPGNALFWSYAVEWVAGNAQLVDTEVINDPYYILPVTATELERQRISILTTIVMPLFVLAVGGVVWYVRRRR